MMSQKKQELSSICVITDMSGRSISAEYQNKIGTVNIVSGKNTGCPDVVLVDNGEFIENQSASNDPNPAKNLLKTGKKEIVVGFKDSTSFDEGKNIIMKQYNLKILQEFQYINAFVVEVPADAEDNWITKLSDDANIKYAEKQSVYSIEN